MLVSGRSRLFAHRYVFVLEFIQSRANEFNALITSVFLFFVFFSCREIMRYIEHGVFGCGQYVRIIKQKAGRVV